nr:hypothetical protein Ade03nite_27870 [Actinoplanes derwentensis]
MHGHREPTRDQPRQADCGGTFASRRPRTADNYPGARLITRSGRAKPAPREGRRLLHSRDSRPFVFDHVGDDDLVRSWQLLRRGNTLVSYGTAPSKVLKLLAADVLTPQVAARIPLPR